jgi:hypothetical protein
MKIRGDIHNFVRIPSVNDTGNKLLPVSLLLAINYSPVSLTPVIKPYPGFSSIP